MTAIDNSRSRCVCGESKWRWAGPSKEAHPRCDRPERLVCQGCDAVLVRRCSRSSRVACIPCSESYRHRVRRVFESGYSDRPTDRLHLLTVTAPGRRQHRRNDGSWCRCTPKGGVNLAEWNASAGANFNHFMTYLRRLVGDVQYARAAEVQERGALHFHVLVRLPAGTDVRALWAPGDPDCPLRLLAIRWGFGHEIDLQAVDCSSSRAANYCAKYVSKSASDRDSLPWLDVRTGEVTTGCSRYRVWTASRRWGLTMAAIRAAQAAWWQADSAGGGREGAQRPEAGAGGTDGRQAGGALDHSSRSYTAVVRSAGGVPCWQSLSSPLGAVDGSLPGAAQPESGPPAPPKAAHHPERVTSPSTRPSVGRSRRSG